MAVAPILKYIDALICERAGDSDGILGDEFQCFFGQHFKTPHPNHLKVVLDRIKMLSDEAPEDKKQIAVSAQFFTPLVAEHWELTRQYGLLRKRLREDFRRKETPVISNSPCLLAQPEKIDDVLIHQLQVAMVLAALLGAVHRVGLNVPREEKRYISEQKEYAQLLFDQGVNTDLSFEPRPKLPFLGTQHIRDGIVFYNPIRLFLLRLRRLCFLLMPFVPNKTAYQDGLNLIEQHGSFFIFSNLAWVFFLPRLLTNLGLMYRHVFDRSSMSEIEHALGWRVRLQAQLVRRWQELANDSAWFSTGLTTCFFLAGKTPVIGVYLGVAMQGYDLLMAVIRVIIELRRFYRIEKRYEDMLDDSLEMQTFRADLRERVILESQWLALNLLNFIVLLLCVVAMIPAMGLVSPIIPLIGSIVAALMTIVNYMMTRLIDSQRAQKYVHPLINKNKSCCSMLSPTIPSTNTDELVLGDFFNAGYIRVKNDACDALYYVNKKTKVHLLMSSTPEALELYDAAIDSPLNQPKSLSHSHLLFIETSFDHKHECETVSSRNPSLHRGFSTGWGGVG